MRASTESTLAGKKKKRKGAKKSYSVGIYRTCLHLFCPNRLAEHNKSIARVDFEYITFSSISRQRKNLTCRNTSFWGENQNLRNIKTPRILNAALAKRSARGTPLRGSRISGWESPDRNLVQGKTRYKERTYLSIGRTPRNNTRRRHKGRDEELQSFNLTLKKVYIPRRPVVSFSNIREQ